jgi:uncharacterized protein (DUF2062 family)
VLTSHTLWPFIGYRLVLAALLAWALVSKTAIVPAG